MIEYRFDPHQLRSAYRNIAERFPLQRDQQPPGLDMLFEMLESMDLNLVEEWGRSLGERELNLLCGAYHRNRRKRAVMVLAILLALIGDRRCSQVARYLFLLKPPESVWAEMRPYWFSNRVQELVATDAIWVTNYLKKQPLLEQLEFVMDQLLAGRIELEQLEEGFSLDTPLFEALLAFLFGDGCKMLHYLPTERAASAVARFLKRGDDQQVCNYLEHYPNDRWKPEVIEEIYRLKGAPNQRANAFYRKMERGAIWSYRRYLFEPALDAVSPEAYELWQRWIHRCFDLKWIQSVAHIYIFPFHFIEKPLRTLAQSLSNPDSTIIVERDGSWSNNMEALLQKHTVWE